VIAVRENEAKIPYSIRGFNALRDAGGRTRDPAVNQTSLKIAI
jgi:hypothetical protein